MINICFSPISWQFQGSGTTLAMNGHDGADVEQDNSLDVPDDMLKDDFCDPDNPVVINFREISAAAYKIQGGIQQTPCTVSA